MKAFAMRGIAVACLTTLSIALSPVEDSLLLERAPAEGEIVGALFERRYHHGKHR